MEGQQEEEECRCLPACRRCQGWCGASAAMAAPLARTPRSAHSPLPDKGRFNKVEEGTRLPARKLAHPPSHPPAAGGGTRAAWPGGFGPVGPGRSSAPPAPLRARPRSGFVGCSRPRGRAAVRAGAGFRGSVTWFLMCVFSFSPPPPLSLLLPPPLSSSPNTHVHTHASPLPPPPQGRKGKPNLQPTKAFGIVACAPSGTAPKPSNAASAMSGKAPPQGTSSPFNAARAPRWAAPTC